MFSKSCVPFGTKTKGGGDIYTHTLVRFGSICETANLTLWASLKDTGKGKKKKARPYSV